MVYTPEDIPWEQRGDREGPERHKNLSKDTSLDKTVVRSYPTDLTQCALPAGALAATGLPWVAAGWCWCNCRSAHGEGVE